VKKKEKNESEAKKPEKRLREIANHHSSRKILQGEFQNKERSAVVQENA
jgi:hypothetical protein